MCAPTDAGACPRCRRPARPATAPEMGQCLSAHQPGSTPERFKVRAACGSCACPQLPLVASPRSGCTRDPPATRRAAGRSKAAWATASPPLTPSTAAAWGLSPPSPPTQPRWAHRGVIGCQLMLPSSGSMGTSMRHPRGTAARPSMLPPSPQPAGGRRPQGAGGQQAVCLP